WLALDGRDLAGLDELLEALQVLPYLLARLLPEQPGHRLAEHASWRVVLEVHAQLCALIGGRTVELDPALVRDLGAFHRPPRDDLAGHVLDYRRLPLDLGVGRALRDPVGATLVEDRHGLQVLHEFRQPWQVAPALVQLRRRPADRQALSDIDAHARA